MTINNNWTLMKLPKLQHAAKIMLPGLIILSSFQALPAASKNMVCEAHIAVAAERHKIPVAVLYAVGLTESGRGDRLHPFALNVEGKTYFPASENEAVLIVNKARSSGKKLIDLGCMQINHWYHAKRFSNLREMFDPALNVDYAARFLRRLKRTHGSWSMAVARYHAGAKNHAAQQKYVCKVLRHMISQGLAKSTASSKKICNSN